VYNILVFIGFVFLGQGQRYSDEQGNKSREVLHVYQQSFPIKPEPVAETIYKAGVA